MESPCRRCHKLWDSLEMQGRGSDGLVVVQADIRRKQCFKASQIDSSGYLVLVGSLGVVGCCAGVSSLFKFDRRGRVDLNLVIGDR